jgi:hypothetical protein
LVVKKVQPKLSDSYSASPIFFRQGLQIDLVPMLCVGTRLIDAQRPPGDAEVWALLNMAQSEGARMRRISPQRHKDTKKTWAFSPSCLGVLVV